MIANNAELLRAALLVLARSPTMPSTVIRNYHYDAASRELTLHFVTGRRYVYFDVPPEEVQGLKASGSLGRYFNRRIRDHYRYQELARAAS